MSRLFRRLSLLFALCLLGTGVARAQFADASTGLLQMPTAEMQQDGTFMITNNFLNKHATSTRWSYHTFQYGFAVSFWGRVEIGYVCTIFNDYWQGYQSRPGVWMINQDRHFTGRVLLLREGDGFDWMPALVFGMSDPVTGGSEDYLTPDKVDNVMGNGFFNREFFALTKHFQTPWGEVGAHVGYQFNRRLDYPINAPCAGVNWQPVWLQDKGIFDSLNCIAEFDSRTLNLGFVASVWDNRFEAMFELQNFQGINFGLRYKLRLKK